MGNFYYEECAGSDGNEMVVNGRDALLRLYERQKALFDDGAQLKLDDLRPMHIYSWLLDKDHMSNYTKWCEAACATAW